MTPYLHHGVEKRSNLMMKTLVEKLAMARATRSVKVVIVIVTPTCPITYHDLDV